MKRHAARAARRVPSIGAKRVSPHVIRHTTVDPNRGCNPSSVEPNPNLLVHNQLNRVCRYSSSVRSCFSMIGGIERQIRHASQEGLPVRDTGARASFVDVRD